SAPCQLRTPPPTSTLFPYTTLFRSFSGMIPPNLLNPCWINAPKIVGELVNPICLATDNVPIALPFCLPAALDVSTVNGAPSANLKPILAITVKSLKERLVYVKNASPPNPIIAINPERTSVCTRPRLSTKKPPPPAPIPDASASGVIQYPDLAAGIPITCSANDGINITAPIKVPDISANSIVTA